MKAIKIYSKKILLLTALIGMILSCSKEDDNSDGQLHYFRFSSCPKETHSNWQDISFVTIISNPEVITKCKAELRLSLEERTLFH